MKNEEKKQVPVTEEKKVALKDSEVEQASGGINDRREVERKEEKEY